MQITIRNTKKEDFAASEFITREAFWDVYKPGCDEHLVLHQLRKSKSYVKELDFVAFYENKLIGHIISTKAKVVNAENKEFEVLCVGPLCVLHEFQKHGFGSQLMQKSIEKANELGYTAMILFGNPEYYHRFGFKNAAEFKISTKEGENFEPFMALELQNESLKSVSGKFYEDSSFEINSDDLEKFEKGFPYREKHKTDTQIL